MPATERLPGTLGPYRLQDRLGEGGMGVVHLARDPEGRLVAIKVLHPLGTEGPNARRRLAREVETMRRVRSPYVAEVLDADVTGEFPYIVTRYVSGPTLDEMVRRHGPLPAPGLRRLAHGMAEALTAIHAAGVVHRDLKPGNVMLSDDRPIVIDFGIAQAGDATRLTQTGLVMGTPGYLAPEVIEGHPSSPASDVHCWGTTMAFAATGHLPFGSGSYESIFYRIVSGRADLNGVPELFVPLIAAALARDPADRPSASWLSAQASVLSAAGSGPAAGAPGSYAPTATGLAVPGLAAVPGAAAAVPGPYVPGPYVPGGPLAAASAAPAAAQAPPYLAPRQAARDRDVADLLPPVSYATAEPRRAQGPQGPQGQPQGLKQGAQPAWPPQNPSQQNARQQNARQQNARQQDPNRQDPNRQDPNQPGSWPENSQQQDQRSRAQTRPATMAGLAVMVSATALTVVLPVAGLIASLVVITLLRAADRAQSTLAVRRSVRGPRASDLLVVLVMAPLTVARALLTEVLIAPFALFAGAVAYAATVVLTHSADMPRAGAYALAAIVAWYGLGPGSGKPRRQLNRMAGVLARSPASAAVTTLAVWALAAAAVLFAASQTPYYWPAVAPHLPGIGNLISSAANWLLRNLHR
jgi:predicted Ser/Thr protein kinase